MVRTKAPGLSQCQQLVVIVGSGDAGDIRSEEFIAMLLLLFRDNLRFRGRHDLNTVPSFFTPKCEELSG